MTQPLLVFKMVRFHLAACRLQFKTNWMRVSIPAVGILKEALMLATIVWTALILFILGSLTVYLSMVISYRRYSKKEDARKDAIVKEAQRLAQEQKDKTDGGS